MNTSLPLRWLNGHPVADGSVSVESLYRICELLAYRMGNDFSCYRGPSACRRIEKRMHDGNLFLGTAESVAPARKPFAPLNAKWRIYRRQEAPNTWELPFRPITSRSLCLSQPADSRDSLLTTRLIERALVRKYAATRVVVNSRGDIAYINGHTGAYLNLVAAQGRLNVLEMIDPRMRSLLAGALLEAAATRAEVVLPARTIAANDVENCVEVRVSPLPGSNAVVGMSIVDFRPVFGRKTAPSCKPKHKPPFRPRNNADRNRVR
jgi:two-component system CheB/CheR fusion protein